MKEDGAKLGANVQMISVIKYYFFVLKNDGAKLREDNVQMIPLVK